ncbi:MAG: hypothetical protein AB1568_10525 [Thermodesulfobacteriota bacterium]
MSQHDQQAPPPPEEQPATSLSQQDAPASDPNRLTPSEIESLKQARRSAIESTKKLYPHIKFV